MSVRVVRSEVKFKVRRNALLLGEFTIAQLVRATGLNPESVRTEVQRLRQEGMVIAERMAGRREALYRLSDDPEKRLALSRSLEAFYPEPPEPIPSRPASRMYQAALRSLDQAEMKEGQKQEELLAQAAHELEGAWQAEGASRAPELVQAHILRERGRLAWLQGQREPARELLTRGRKFFAASGLESEVRLTDEYLVCVEAGRRTEVSRASDDAARARCVLEAIEAAGYPITSPLVRLLVDLVQKLSITMTKRVAGEILITVTHRKVFEMGEDLRRLAFELIPRLTASQERPDMFKDLSETIELRREPNPELSAEFFKRVQKRPTNG